MGEYVESLAPIAPLLGLQLVLMALWLVEANRRRKAEDRADRYFWKWRELHAEVVSFRRVQP